MIQTLDQAPAPFKGTEIHTLPNGLKLLLKSDPSIPVVAMQVWSRCGAIDESPNIYGISHGLEHMVFKGTPTRSAGEITHLIESNGGVINAATQLETTHYYIEVPSYGAEVAMDVLADTILHPTFPQEELERERLVILEEIHRRDDSPDATLWDEFAAQVFKNTPYGIKVIGSIETVSNLSRHDLSTYFNAHYVPEKLCVVVTGDFKTKKMLAQLTRLFSELKDRPAPATPAIHMNDAAALDVEFKKPIQNTYFGMGFPTVGIGHPDTIALDVLSDILGGSVSSRLYQKIREEEQLVISVSCDYMSFQQKGLFAIFGEAFPASASKALDRIRAEMGNLKSKPIKSEEVARAKARIKSEWLYGSETPAGQASTLGSLSVLGHVNLINTYLTDLERLNQKHLMDVYEKYILNKPFSVTLLSPESVS